MIERPDWMEAGEPVAPPVLSGEGAVAPLDRSWGEERGGDGADLPPSLLAELDPDLIAEWEKAGGLEHRLGVARHVAGQLLERLPTSDRARFLSDFDALPEAAQSAIFSELALDPDGSVRGASDAAVARFASTEEGAALVKAWGHRAARNVAVLQARMQRILAQARMIDAADALEHWFEALTPEAAMAIHRMLVR